MALALGVVLAIAGGPARAERGRVIAQLTGGASMVVPDLPQPGGVIAVSLDYGAWDRVSLVLGAQGVLHRAWDTLGVGAGLKIIPWQGEWARLYLLVEPALLLAWPDTPAGHGALQTGFAAFGGIGLQYLMLWGLGFAIELTGTLPLVVDRGGAALDDRRWDAASLHLAAGLYMEF